MDKKIVLGTLAVTTAVIYLQQRHISKIERQNRKLKLWAKTVQPLMMEIWPQLPKDLKVSQKTATAIDFYMIIENEL